MMHPWLLKHSPHKKGVDGFIEFILGKEQLDNWTLGPDPGPLPGGRRGVGPAAAHKGNAPGGPLGNLQSVKNTKGQRNMGWARERD